MNVLVADGNYFQSDRRLVGSILDQVWFVRSNSPGDMGWLPDCNIIDQADSFDDYYDFLWYVTANFYRGEEYVLILDKEKPGAELSPFSPIYMNSPSRLSEMTRRGIRFSFDPLQTRPTQSK